MQGDTVGDGASRRSEEELISYALDAIRKAPDAHTYVTLRITDSPDSVIDVPPGYVNALAGDVALFGDVAVAPAEIEHWLLLAAQDPQTLFAAHSMVPEGYVGSLSEAGARVARRFLYHWFTEIRGIICEGEQLGAAARTADLSSKTVVTSLAVWLMGTFAVTSPVAVGLATVILLVLGQAAKSALCQMTRAEVIDQVSRQLEKPG